MSFFSDIFRRLFKIFEKFLNNWKLLLPPWSMGMEYKGIFINIRIYKIPLYNMNSQRNFQGQVLNTIYIVNSFVCLFAFQQTHFLTWTVPYFNVSSLKTTERPYVA